MRRLGRIILNLLIALSLLLCIASVVLMIAARNYDGLKLDVGPADGVTAYAQAYSDGTAAMLVSGRWTHPKLLSLTSGPRGMHKPGERDFHVFMIGSSVTRGLGPFRWITGQGLPAIYDGPNGGAVRPAVRPRYTATSPVPYAYLTVPTWAPPACFALFPLAFFVRRWARRRADRLKLQRGLCQACSYDLKGNVSGVCPECGTAVEPR